MQIKLIVLSVIAAMGLAAVAPLDAETLPIHVIVPAGNDRLAELRSISIGYIAGEGARPFGITLEQMLRNIRVAGVPYFTVVSARQNGGTDGVINGEAYIRFARHHERSRRRECAVRDEKGGCQATRYVNIICIRRVITFDYSLTVDGRREPIYADANTAANSEVICPDGGRLTPESIVVRQLIGGVVDNLRRQFAPTDFREEVRVKEGLDGLKGDAKRQFNEAKRLTKRNTAAACAAWADLDRLNPDHAPTLFNLGLCAESRRDYAGARSYYSRVMALNRSQDYAANGLGRLNRRDHADQQLEAHSRTRGG